MINDKLAPEPENQKPSREGIGVLSITGGLTGLTGSLAVTLPLAQRVGYEVAGLPIIPLIAGGVTLATVAGMTLGYAFDLYVRSR